MKIKWCVECGALLVDDPDSVEEPSVWFSKSRVFCSDGPEFHCWLSMSELSKGVRGQTMEATRMNR